MRTQCNSKPLEFEGHCSRRRQLGGEKLIFLFVFLRAPSWSLLTRAMIRCEFADSREYKAAVS